MSVVFYLEGKPLSIADWNSLLSDWAVTASPYEDPTLREDGEDFVTRLWEPGSIRGVLVRVDPREKKHQGEVHLKAFSSRKDWSIAFALLRALSEAAQGKVVREDGKVYGQEDLTEERADADAVWDFCMTAKAIVQQAGRRFWLPVGPFKLPIETLRIGSCTPETMPELEGELAGRVQRYASAAAPEVYNSPRGTMVARWNFDAAVLPKVDEIACPAQVTEETPEGGWVCVPFEHALSVLGDLAEDLGDYVFVPELESERDREVLEALVEPGKALDFELEGEEEAKRRLPIGPTWDFEAAREPAEEAEDLPDEVLEHIAKILSLIATFVVHGHPADVLKTAVQEILSPEVADSFIELVTVAARKLLVKHQSPSSVVEDLVASGIPAPVAQLTVGAVLEAAESTSD